MRLHCCSVDTLVPCTAIPCSRGSLRRCRLTRLGGGACLPPAPLAVPRSARGRPWPCGASRVRPGLSRPLALPRCTTISAGSSPMVRGSFPMTGGLGEEGTLSPPLSHDANMVRRGGALRGTLVSRSLSLTSLRLASTWGQAALLPALPRSRCCSAGAVTLRRAFPGSGVQCLRSRAGSVYCGAWTCSHGPWHVFLAQRTHPMPAHALRSLNSILPPVVRDCCCSPGCSSFCP